MQNQVTLQVLIWFVIYKSNLFMTLFLNHPHFTYFYTSAGNSSQYFADGFLQASWRHCHSSSGFSLSQFVLFLPVIPDRLDYDQIRSDLCVEHWLLSDSLCIQKSHWIIITINSINNVWKWKLIFPTNTLQQNIEITDLKLFLFWWTY